MGYQQKSQQNLNYVKSTIKILERPHPKLSMEI